jgi:hypothetical protein
LVCYRGRHRRVGSRHPLRPHSVVTPTI